MARFFCCGLAGLIVGVYAVDAAAQESLRVDPALLGLPPVVRGAEAKPAEPRPVPVAAPAKVPPTTPVPSAAPPSAATPDVAKPAATATAPAAIAAKPAAAATTVAASAPVPTPVPTPAPAPAPAPTQPPAEDKNWLQRLWAPVANAYTNGDWDAYLPLHTHHLRSAYSAEKIATYQESPLGFGFGTGLYNEKGNWEGVYAMAFQDSHFKPMYVGGYGWKAIWRPAQDVRLGLGYSALLMSRTDIMHYVPFPIVLPLASVAYKNLSIEGTYVPGGEGFGNIFFIWAKWEFGKKGEAIGTPAPQPVPPAPTQTAMSSSPSVGTATPSAAKVPYGPALAAQPSPPLAGPDATPPQVAATGRRDEEADPGAPPLALRASPEMVPLPKDSAVPTPIFLTAQRMAGQAETEFVAEGDAELRKIGTVVTSDRLTYWPIEDEMEAEGNVRLEQGTDVVTGPKMRMKLEDQVGFFEQPTYTFQRGPQPGSKAAADKAFAQQYLEEQPGDYWTSGFAPPPVIEFMSGQANVKQPSKLSKIMPEAHGHADRIDFAGENQVRLTNSTYTTCTPGDVDWYMKSKELKLDYDHEVGDAKHGVVYFKDVPILYSPWLTFPLNNERRSGFLPPSFGTTSDSGFEFTQPYYWNIAPNMDATIVPTILTKRGVQLSTEARYLNTAYGGLYNGQARVEVLPGDRVRDGEDRYGISFTHTQAMANGFSGAVNYNRVSDDNYYTDLSSRVSNTSATQLLQQGTVTYGGGGWWNATANFQQYQTLQPDDEEPVGEQYRMLPQFTLNARKPDFGFTDSSFLGQYTAFVWPQGTAAGAADPRPDGQRAVLYPQVAFPYITPAWYVTPKIGVNVRNYALSNQAAGIPDTITSTLPVFSVDSGMTFERPSTWYGREYTQTLEPRLYYVNIPFKDQSKIPLFDTTVADFNFAQIFSENQFAGWDRINDANQLTAAVTSRLLDPTNGNELVRVMLGQRYYFSPTKVTLAGTAPAPAEDTNWDRSDFLAAFSGQLLPKVFVDTAVQFNGSTGEFGRFSLGGHYRPEPGKVFNAAYRYNADVNAPVDQVDFSGQWPLSGRWHAVGRFNYSFHDEGTDQSTESQGGRVIEAIAGLEYNGGCWVVRAVAQRLALTREDTSSSFFIQLELNDFARIGSNPIGLLQRNISGYGLINQPVASPAFGQ